MRWPFRVACTASVVLLLLATALVTGGDAGAQQSDAPRTSTPLASTLPASTLPASTLPASTLESRVSATARAASVSRAPQHGARRESIAPDHRESGSVSVGRHNTGRLINGREIVESEHVRIKHPNGDQHHGTDELVSLLERAASTVAGHFPGSRLTVGDLSRHRGGRFRPHRSHRSGRDVDVGFYVVDPNGELVYHDRFVDFRADGTTRANADWRFDDARNWAFVAAVLGQDEVPVQYMFVARWLKQRLLDYAASIGAPQELIDRAAVVLDQPSRGGRHEDHFHVRIYCPADDRPRCIDDAPWHAWVPRPSPEQLAELRRADQSRRHARLRARRRAEREVARRRERRRDRATAVARPLTDRQEEIPGG